MNNVWDCWISYLIFNDQWELSRHVFSLHFWELDFSVPCWCAEMTGFQHETLDPCHSSLLFAGRFCFWIKVTLACFESHFILCAPKNWSSKCIQFYILFPCFHVCFFFNDFSSPPTRRLKPFRNPPKFGWNLPRFFLGSTHATRHSSDRLFTPSLGEIWRWNQCGMYISYRCPVGSEYPPPPKFNMEPENDGFQKESPFPGTSFQVPC